MPINPKLLAFLTASGARYTVFPHHVEYTSPEVAEAAHLPGRVLVKAVVLRDLAGSYLVAALPSSMSVDLKRLERLTGREHLTLASEHELRLLFPDCQVGTAPPFGRLYGIEVWMDPCLFEGAEIYFQAGNHREVVGMSAPDLRRLARSVVAVECIHAPLLGAREPRLTNAANH